MKNCRTKLTKISLITIFTTLAFYTHPAKATDERHSLALKPGETDDRLRQKIESIEHRLKALETQEGKFIKEQSFQLWPPLLFPNLTLGSGLFSALSSITVLIALDIHLRKKKAQKTRRQNTNQASLQPSNPQVQSQINKVNDKVLHLESRLNTFILELDTRKRQLQTDLNRNDLNSPSSRLFSSQELSNEISQGEILRDDLTSNRQESLAAQKFVALLDRVRSEFGKNNDFFRSEDFQPMRAATAWQGIVNNEGVSSLNLENCQEAEASYLRFSNDNQDYLIPNATNPRLKQQILQLEQENSSAFQIRVGTTGELKLHQAARIARNGADGWSVIEPGLIER